MHYYHIPENKRANIDFTLAIHLAETMLLLAHTDFKLGKSSQQNYIRHLKFKQTIEQLQKGSVDYKLKINFQAILGILRESKPLDAKVFEPINSNLVIAEHVKKKTKSLRKDSHNNNNLFKAAVLNSFRNKENIERRPDKTTPTKDSISFKMRWSK